MAMTIAQAETLPWDLVARPCGRRWGQGKQPTVAERRMALGIDHVILQMKKPRLRQTSR